MDNFNDLPIGLQCKLDDSDDDKDGDDGDGDDDDNNVHDGRWFLRRSV